VSTLQDLRSADWSIQFVVTLTACCFVWVWIVVVGRLRAISSMRRAINQFEGEFWSGGSLDDLYRTVEKKASIGSEAVFRAVMREYIISIQANRLHGLNDRLPLVMSAFIGREVERLEKGLLLLSTIGSFAGAFIGLAGAIWGIMASSQPTTGGRETALGASTPNIELVLLAAVIAVATAVPAKVFNDKFVTEVKRLTLQMQNFAAEFRAIISRQVGDGGK
jgi:biopolymer transport protein TolQ